MAEAHQPLARFDFLAQHFLGAGDVADLEDHVQRRAGRAAVQRTLERADGAGDGGDKVGAGGDDDARGEGRGIEAVVDHGVEVGLQAAHVRFIRQLAGEHVEVIRGMAEVRARRDGRLVVEQAPVRGDDDGEGAEEHARGGFVSVGAGFSRRMGRLKPAATQRGGGHAQRVHRIDALLRGGGEQIERHRRQLAAAFERTSPQQLHRLLERGVRGQLLD